MKKFSFIAVIILLTAFSTTIVFAQDDAPVRGKASQQAGKTRPPSVIEGGVLNGKAVSLVQPSYPEAAKAVHAGGAVNVQIVIDESGAVISATATSGHPLLRAAAVEAARASKFTPTTLSGVPVKVTGKIVYNFVGNKPSYEESFNVLAIGTYLAMMRASADDLGKMKQALDMKEIVPRDLTVNASPELQSAVKELDALADIEQTPREKRLDLIDNVKLKIKAKLQPKDVWQFEVGQNFGDVFGQFFKIVNGDTVDMSKFDEAAIKLDLAKMKDLLYAAPPDAPTAVLNELKSLVALSEQDKLTQPENLKRLLSSIIKVAETISPDAAENDQPQNH